jgi:hypothetical protein
MRVVYRVRFGLILESVVVYVGRLLESLGLEFVDECLLLNLLAVEGEVLGVTCLRRLVSSDIEELGLL